MNVFENDSKLECGPGNLRRHAEAAAGAQDQGEEAEGVLQLRRRQSKLQSALQKSAETGRADIIDGLTLIATYCEHWKRPQFWRNTERRL